MTVLPLSLGPWCLAALLLAGPATSLAGEPCATGPAEAAALPMPMPQRGVWIATPEHNHFFDSPAEMARQLDEFKRLGINTVYAAMWNQGRTLYPSAVMQRLTGVPIDEKLAGRDPLQELITAARSRGIKVYAWFEYGFATDFKGGLGHEIIDTARPQWAALDAQGKQVVKNGFRWLNALDPEVQGFVQSLLLEAAERYDLDGIQGDDRLPALPSSAGYDPVSVAMYKREHDGRSPPANAKEPAWLAWRAGKLNGFMQRLHASLKAAKPQLQISMSPSPYPWGYDEYLQDWPTWLKNGWVDSVSPQLYRYDIAGYRTELRKITREQLCPAQLGRVFPGILLSLGRDYIIPVKLLNEVIDENRREGITGEVYFHSEGLAKRAKELVKLYR